MKRLLFSLVALLLLLNVTQTASGQAIIMGSQPLVNDIDDNMRYFYDPGGIPTQMGANQDPNGYFAPNLRDTMTLQINILGSVFYALFEEFEMDEGDTLWIFDGTDCSANLIGVYNMVSSPGEITASGPAMTFVFHSDNQEIPGLMKGWSAKVSAYDTSVNTVNFGDGYIYNYTCQAEFYDSGGPNGYIAANNENSSGTYYVQFQSPVGTYVKCVFDTFEVNGVMLIYDGAWADANKRLIGQFCTSTLGTTGADRMPPVLFASGNNGTTSQALTFVYKGGANDITKKGWHATISCVPAIFESSDGNVCPEIDNIPPDGYYADFPHHALQADTFEFNFFHPVVVLNADYAASGRYCNDYTVKEIPYNENNMLFSYDDGEPLPPSTDDIWISATQLPTATSSTPAFNFSFFGKQYTMVYPGANGIISFDQHASGSSCAWSTSVPPTGPPYSSTPYNYANAVYGIYEDINPSTTACPGNTAIKVGVLGSYPCRAFVFNYNHIGEYSCCSQGDNMYNTYQMVLYEATNIIDIYVKHRACCTSWNGGRGVIGLQNKTSSQILTVPGMDFGTPQNPITWTADNRAFRFTPITPLDEFGILTWYRNAVHPDSIIKQGPADKVFKIALSPSVTTTYISEYKYQVGSTRSWISILDTTTIIVNIPDVDAKSSKGTNPICPNDSATLYFEYDQTLGVTPAHYQWSTGDTTATSVVHPTQTTTYYLTVTFDNGSRRSDSVQVPVTNLVFPTITATDTIICLGKSTTLTASIPSTDPNLVFTWDYNNLTGPSITISPQVTKKYTVSVTMPGNCVVTDSITITVMPLPVPSFIPSPTEIYVENGVGTVTCTNTTPQLDGKNHLLWNFGDMYSNMNVLQDIEDPTHDYTHSGFYTITLTATDSAGCVDSVKNRVSVEVPYFFYIPNAFSPDGDGLNEHFAPQGQGVDPENYTMQIFDRSGMLIFTTRNPYDYWDGRTKYGQMCPEGVYIYRIILRNLNGDDKEYTGSVTLIR